MEKAMCRSQFKNKSATFTNVFLRSLIGASLCLLLALPSYRAMAQSKGNAEKSTSASGEKPPPYKLPHINVMTKMIQSHMAALGNAIKTNNFSVLRDLGTPEFKKTNSTRRLARIFHPFRKRGADLTAVVLFVPTLHQTPQVASTGHLRLRGYYKTKPNIVHFDLVFLPVSGKWRMHTISARLAPSPQRVSRTSETIERTIVSRVNMRGTPSLKGKLLVTLNPGQKVKVLGQQPGKSWHKVAIAPNVVGYIKSTALIANSK